MSLPHIQTEPALKDYTLTELLENPSFQRWVYRNDRQDVQRWQRWIEQHPQHRKLADEAAMLVRGIAFKQHSLPDEVIDARWTALNARMNAGKAQPKWPLAITYRVAASASLLLMALAGIWFLSQNRHVAITTGFGEIQTLELPDGSKVVLNANSTLSYDPASLHSSDRVVHLQGEAYFDVVRKQQSAPARFVVVTDNAQVEVLGTRFNVNHRRSTTQVVLTSGKVRFNLPEKELATLKPGEKAAYDTRKQALTLEKVNPEFYSSWKQRKLIFDDTSLTELVQILEDNYGLQVIISDKTLLDKRISGEISSQNITILLKAVSRLFGIEVRRSGNHVYFNPLNT